MGSAHFVTALGVDCAGAGLNGARCCDRLDRRMEDTWTLVAQVRVAFDQWLTGAGEAVTDPGSPVRTVAILASGDPASEVEVNGYSVVEAEDVAAVKALLSTHPFIGRGGTFQVSECLTV